MTFFKKKSCVRLLFISVFLMYNPTFIYRKEALILNNFSHEIVVSFAIIFIKLLLIDRMITWASVPKRGMCKGPIQMLFLGCKSWNLKLLSPPWLLLGANDSDNSTRNLYLIYISEGNNITSGIKANI